MMTRIIFSNKYCTGRILTTYSQKTNSNITKLSFPGGQVVKNLSANAGHTGFSPGPGRSHMPQSN